MDQDQAGPQLAADDQERTTEQVREEIEQTRVELGDTVAALAEKTNVKAQAKHAVGLARSGWRCPEAKETVTGKVSETEQTVAAKKDEFVASAQQATPESASDAAHKASIFAQQNRLALIGLAAFGLGVVIGRATTR